MRDLSTTRARVLLLLCRPGVHTQARLSVQLGLQRGPISDALKRLERDGMVSRADLIHDPPTSERRVREYRITDAGRIRAAQLTPEGRP